MTRTYFALVSAMAMIGSVAGATNPIDRPRQAVAKIFGAGGVAGLEGYQTGVFLPTKPPTVLTIDSPVLEWGEVAVVDAFGERLQAKAIGRDRTTGLALLECPPTTEPPATLSLSPNEASIAQPLWVLSNAFGIAVGDEPVSVQFARVASLALMPAPPDATRVRPVAGVPIPGSRVVLLDAVTSNPGAGGGPVVDHFGRLIGMIGAESRSPITGAWLNYAVPVAEMQQAVERMQGNELGRDDREGLAAFDRHVLQQIGLHLIPAFSRRTPAYVEYVRAASPAALAECQPDDLIVAVDGVTVGSVEVTRMQIVRGFRAKGSVELTVLRDRRVVHLLVEENAP